ncbi:centrosomal protein of 68 kDa isoform X2 [Hemicordylus capensis]|uniref:centrosomal protein of 68 kDa isoform X2 n=1 Tax=Hemicordylus capensis TaxID=884348 RepID=UPI00230396DF|nr:centrosomal protein of 68 kDa isoform X2 [Hemicordylus capensis]
MAVEVEKSHFDASSLVKAKYYDRWNYTEPEMDYPELVSKVCQLSDGEDGESLPKGSEDEESTPEEGSGCAIPDLSQRNNKYPTMSLTPSNKFCKIKAKYMERRPLVSKTAYGHSAPRHFSSSGLQTEEQLDQWKTECSNTTELGASRMLQGLMELPVGLANKDVDSKLYRPTTESRYRLDADCNRSQMSFAPYSSTPKHLACKRTLHFTASVPMFPKNSTSLQPLEDSDSEQQEMERSQSFSAARALSSSEMSVPWYLSSLSDPEENNMLGTCKQIPINSCSFVGQVRKMSPFQADYWACAIPDSLPPSPDRHSPHWNPNKEYEELLDYTYPLRPKYKLGKNPKCVVQDSPVHDSGVDLESLSPESTLKSVSVQGQEHPVAGIQCAQRLLRKPECSAPVSDRLSPVGKVSFADGGLFAGCTGLSSSMAHSLSGGIRPDPSGSTSRNQRAWNAMGHDCLPKRDASSSVIRSTRVLPLQKECSGDEEFLSLPPRLKELETLAQQLTALSLTVRKPGHIHVQDDFPCIRMNGEQLLPEVYRVCGGNKNVLEMCCDSQEHNDENLLSKQGYRDHRSMQEEVASTDLLVTKCQEFQDPGGHHVSQEEDYCKDSLAQHIKIFCCRLEELICWLNKVAVVTDNWIPPKPDIESVKASLQSYLDFKKDLVSHQALTEGVLQDGERLLNCIALNSPVLQNTLGLIAKQSDDLESHADRLYASVLTAMDSLGSGLMKNCDDQNTAAQMSSADLESGS